MSAPDAGSKPVKRGRRGPVRKPAAEAPAQREEPAEPAIFTPERRPEPEAPPQAQQAPQDGGQSDSGGSRDVASEQGAGNDGRQGDHQGQGGGNGQGGGGGRGEWQDRNSWKRNKRKRGRHGGGQWQGGQGGGGNAPRYPQQPPPPSPAPVYGDLPDPARFDDLAALDALAKEIGSTKGEPLYLDHLYSLNLADLTAFARSQKVTFEGAPNRLQLLPQIFAKATEDKRALADRGYVDMTDQGYFIVHEHVNYRLYPEDAYLPESLVRRYGLKRGHHVEVRIQPPRDGERCPSVIRIDQVMGHDPEDISKVTPFEELIPYYPLKRILLEDPDIQKDVSMRAVDILTPIGFGQRGLIVAPPRTGKTILLQNIANSVSENSPFAKLILLLVDERPEEVTDFRRHTKGEVVSSTFDEAPESHVHCAEMVGEKARRLVEQGEHVVILLDSITRLARAYNALAGSGGKIMSGGLESNALQKPKRFFGAARNIEGAGSLTIIATALVDTGSRADEIIFEEFKGTGNMELHLDRGLVERRIFPAINIDRSGTRKEELIYHPEELQRIYGLRRAMQGLGPIESMEMLIQRLKKTKSNAEFLLSLSRQ
jgi:transcription termination factor Rho